MSPSRMKAKAEAGIESRNFGLHKSKILFSPEMTQEGHMLWIRIRCGSSHMCAGGPREAIRFRKSPRLGHQFPKTFVSSPKFGSRNNGNLAARFSKEGRQIPPKISSQNTPERGGVQNSQSCPSNFSKLGCQISKLLFCVHVWHVNNLQSFATFLLSLLYCLQDVCRACIYRIRCTHRVDTV